MKVYVRGYGPRPEPEMPERSRFEPVENTWVEYCSAPEWEMTMRDEAESECRIVNRMRVHVGAHYCEFSVEELQEGGFAVVCLNHPEMPNINGS